MSASDGLESAAEMLAGLLREFGLPEPAIERAVEYSDPHAANLGVLLAREALDYTASAAEIEAGGGLSVAETLAILAAVGLPKPDAGEPAFTAEEARTFVRLQQMRTIWPQELTIQLARVYGRHLSRMAQSAVQLFRLFVEPRLRAEGADEATRLLAVQFALDELLPLGEPFLAGVYRRWIDHELAQHAVHTAEVRSDSPLPGAVTVALLFCDVKDFTAYADVHGDAAALTLIDRFTEVVIRERGESFRFYKLLGDGAMLAYNEAGAAVAAGAQIVRGMRSDGYPGVHASVHYGTAIVREGDYFGSTVNLAARLLAVAGKGELVASRAAVQACDGQFSWQPVGPVRLRGFAEPIDVLRLTL